MAFDWRKRKRPQGLRGLEPFCVGLNPPQAAAAGKPPFVAATFQFLKISCPFGTSLLKLLRVSRSALVGAFLSNPLLGTSAINLFLVIQIFRVCENCSLIFNTIFYNLPNESVLID